MVNPFERPPAQFNEDEKKNFEKGRFVADPSKDRGRVYINPRSEKTMVGLGEIAENFEKNTQRKSRNAGDNATREELESSGKRAITVIRKDPKSKRKIPNRIEIVQKKEAA